MFGVVLQIFSHVFQCWLPHKAASRNQDKTRTTARWWAEDFQGVSFLGGLFCLWQREFQKKQAMKNIPKAATSCVSAQWCHWKKKKNEKKKPSGCKYPTLHTLQSPLGQMCQAHVGGRTEQHISYGPKTWSTNIFYIIIIQNEWKFLPPSSSPKNIAHYEHRAMLPTLQEHKYHLSLFVLCSSWKVEKWLRDKWFLKSPQGL